MNPTQQAAQQLNPVYNSVTGGIQNQIPAIQQLYSTLVQGLQAQQGAQFQNVLASAAQRGVGGGELANNTQDALGGAYNQALAPLALQNAQNVSGLQGQIGQANVGRANTIQQLADSLANQNIESKTNKLKLQQLNQNAQLDMAKNQQQYNVQQAQHQAAQAKQAAQDAKDAANFDPTTVSEKTAGLQFRNALLKKAGKDGKVSPETLATYYNQWTQVYGNTPQSFWQRFQGFWDTKSNWGTSHPKDYGNVFHTFVNNGAGLK